jgi:uncharacterized protein YyaL (SSP411 family)
MSNYLIHENSPYLLQHAQNPVDWFPWGKEALLKARSEDKPIFLSIGYAACHWCHVMEHESFEDPETANLMNDYFVCIKVDREERPDLDHIYMQATTALNGSGGWPMSVFLTPNLRPFYAGTYFPPVRRFNLPSFKDVLNSLAMAWRERRDEIESAGSQLLQHLQLQTIQAEKGAFTFESLEAATQSLLDSYDWQYGGWGGAPKFPQPMTIEFLLRRSAGNSPQRLPALKAVRHALDAMARGGMYDVVAGGFARYSVDDFWRTPHFEKMLYDNAQLALVYLHGYLLTGERRYRRVCEATLDFLLREMTHPAGGFYSSLDADSEGQEGKFYIWTQAELMSALGPDYEFFQAAYGITAQGNWEGKTILQRAIDDGTLAALFPNLPAHDDVEPVPVRLAQCHAKLLALRETRLRPATDDKVLVFWNALACSAFAEAGRYLERQDYLDAAICNARFLLRNLYDGDRLLRSWRDGQAKHNAYLEDHAAFCLVLLALYQSDPNPEWYIAALKLADEMVAHFTDPTGGFFDTRHDHEPLPVRPKDLQDNATPSGNALAVMALLQLAAYGDRLEWRDTAERMLAQSTQLAKRYPTAFAQWLCAADFALEQTHEVALLGEPEEAAQKALVRALWKGYRPHLVAAISPYPPAPGSPALLKDRPLLSGQPTAYVCQGLTCLQPVNTAEAMEAQLSAGK